MTDYENKQICLECDDKCCKRFPGACFPEDFDLDNLLESLKKAFRSGKYSIDWLEKDPRPDGDLDRIFFVRPSRKKNGRLYDHLWTGTGDCVFLTDTGCELQLEKRPGECRQIEPRKDSCINHAGGREVVAMKWIPYQEIILEAARRF
jgi:hypothetical protein